MKTTILTLGFALFTLGAVAQETMSAPPPATVKGDKHACIMASADTWTSLGLNADQIAKVKDIQASCKKEYDASKADATKATASVNKHEEQLKAVLTPEQYTKWSQWCAETHGTMGTKSKSETTK